MHGIRPVRRGGAGDAFVSPFWGTLFQNHAVFCLHPHFRPQNGHFLKDSHPLFKRLRVSLGIVTEYLFYPDQVGGGGGQVLGTPKNSEIQNSPSPCSRQKSEYHSAPGLPGNRWLPVTSAIKHISTQDCIACNYCKGLHLYNSMHVSLEIPVFRQISAFRNSCTIGFSNNDALSSHNSLILKKKKKKKG